MIHNTLTRKERRQIRYAFTQLAQLGAVIQEARTSMEDVAAQIDDKYLKRSVLTFVAETAPCALAINKQLETLSCVFPANDLHLHALDAAERNKFNSPFECAVYFEKKTTQSFRALMNDYEIICEIRNSLQSYLNDMLYAFLKIKLLNSFSFKELSGEKSLF